MTQKDPTPKDSTPKDSKAAFTLQGALTFAVAVLVLIGYAVFVGYMWGEGATTNETAWNRAVFLFTGVETIVFAAVGFLFGKEVHRQQAVNAEDRAKDAEADAKDSRAKGAKGEALAAAVKGLAAGASTHQGTSKAAVTGGGTSADAADSPHPLTALAAMANELFP